jgi:hypothetical protein
MRPEVADLIARARDAVVPVITLTDEELAALDGPEAAPVAPQPWLAGQESSGKLLACRVALRGLAARGIVLPTGHNRGDRRVVAIHQDVRSVLVMRRTAYGLVLAQRRGPLGRDARMLYLHDGGVLEESISPGGMHALSVAAPAAAAGRLAGFADPENIANTRCDESPQIMALSDIAAGTGPTRLESARFITTAGRLTQDVSGQPDEQRISIYALTDRLILTEPAADASDQSCLAMGVISADGLRQRMARLVEGEPDDA